MKHKLLCLVLFVIGPAALLAQVNEGFKSYELYIKSEIDAGKIPGATTQVWQNGKMVYENAQGVSSVADKRAMKVDDIFFIQSMTKPVITVAFMMLYEEGKFQLTDRLSKYLPAAKDLKVVKNTADGIAGPTDPLKREITLADLLSHTAGFSHGLGSSQYEKDIAKGQYGQQHKDVRARVDNLLSMPLQAQPGEKWAYSAAPDILSVLIERFSGMSTNDFLTTRIFKPLGMKDTGYNLTKEQQARVVKLHQRKNDALVVTEYQPTSQGNALWSGVNGLFSTVADYSIFCQMLLNNGTYNKNKILSRKTIELMTQNHTGDLYEQAGEEFGYGFAVLVSIADSKQPGSQGIFYWAGAFNTHFFIDPKEKVTAVFMTQTDIFNRYYHDKMRQLVLQAID